MDQNSENDEKVSERSNIDSAWLVLAVPVYTVEVRYSGEGVVVPGGEETDSDAGGGEQVEHGVQQLGPDTPAATTRPVHQHA